MSLLSATNLSMSFGERTLFSGADFLIETGDRVGLVGPNGCGKTTILKLITGEFTPTSGGFAKAGGISIGYLEQHTCRDSNRTAYDEALTVFEKLHELEDTLKKINLSLATNHSDELLEKQAVYNERYVALGGLTYKSRTRSALLGLGLTEEELELPTRALSGGQKSKIGLAKLLLCEPQLILLDEPTNHLDIEAVEWLEEFLQSFSGAALIISHDRYFLDKVTNKTLEISHGQLLSSKGNYSRHLELSAERKKTIEREYENKMREIKRIEGIIAQQRTFSMERNYRTIDHKQKSIDRIKAELIVPESEEKTVDFDFHPLSDTGNDVLKCEGLTRIYDNKTLYNDISLDIKRKEHVFLLGANGSGKTTLLKELLTSPKVRLGARVTVGYFDQLQSDLDPNNTVLDEVHNAYLHLGETAVRSALAAFLFSGDDVFKKIEDLSGGERARVALVKLMLSGSNLLLLDEPTNHLDLPSREALEKALLNYGGTIIAVSHDRYFINRLANKILWLQDGSITAFSGNYDEFVEGGRKPATTVVEKKKKQMGSGGAEYHERKQRQSEIRRLKGLIGRLEAQIEETEGGIENLNSRLSDPEISADYEKTLELTEKLDLLNNQLETLYEEWSQTNEALSEMEGEE